MTLHLSLPPELERRLTADAARLGLPLETYALQLLSQQPAPPDRRSAAVALLQGWIDEDDHGEHRETGDYLVRALDEDRSSDRQLFPPDLKGVTW
ncbi:MAG: hypothetical protein JNM56_20050 [Planctomycetia bacterium]|nr:hypothetical protein [Planctomycetia bacterium]